MNPLFPAFPEDLAAATSDELTGLLEQSVAAVRAVHERDADVLGDRSDDEILTELSAGIAAMTSIREELERRSAEADAADAIERMSAEALAAAGSDRQARDPESEAQGEAQTPKPGADHQSSGEMTASGDEGDAQAARRGDEDSGAERAEHTRVSPEQVGGGAEGETTRTASAEVAVPERFRGRQRIEVRERYQPIIAAGDVRGVTAGSEFPDRDAFIHAIMHRHDAVSACQNGRRGIDELVPVGTINRRLTEDGRPLVASTYGPEQNFERIIQRIGGVPGSREQVEAMGGMALTADGGLCAPLAPDYTIPTFGVTATPVNSALPTVPATRGGIRWWGLMPWNSGDNTIDDAISHITKAQSDAGGSPAEKTYQRIVCPDTDNEAYVDSHVKRLRIENLKARAWPELVSAFMRNLDVAYAASVETLALDFIAASLPTVTAPAIGNLNTPSTWVSWLRTLTAGISSRNRLDPNARYRCLLPAWVPDLFTADNIKSQMDRFRAEAELVGLLSRANVDVAFYIDSATGGGQLFDAQSSDAEIVGFPDTARAYVYPEGSFVRLDFGSMDLGVVRDSTLNTVNEYELFVEEWFGYAYLGAVEAYEVELSVCPTGQTAGTIAEIGCGS